MKIQTVEFIISAASSFQFPTTNFPEIAFAGKSNVGKSSLMNSLLLRKNLVKTSSTPGKTRLINFFLTNHSFYLVDLPGYGFAKVPKTMQANWRTLIEEYLSHRQPLKGVVLIIDVRHGPSAQDQQLKEWLDHYQIPTLVIANKIDKLKRNVIHKQQELIMNRLHLKRKPTVHSSMTKTGRNEIWKTLEHWISG